MLYEEYRAKLNKWQARFARAWHFRLLFLLAAILLLAFVVAMLSAAGAVSGGSVPGSVVYGAEFSPEVATVFRRKGGYEYREAGEKRWTDEAPRAAGEYECRPYGLSAFGTRRYGAISTFAILPLETAIAAKGSELVYGEEPTFTADLRYGDALVVGSYGAVSESGAIRVTADLETVSVVSETGEDVTDSYRFIAEEKTLRDARRPVRVRTASAASVYDGKPHSADEYAIEGEYDLAEGDRIEAEFPSFVDAGSYANAPTEFRIFDSLGDDVTERYALTVLRGTVEIARRPLSVTPKAEKTAVYDGERHPFAESDFLLSEGGLADGQTAVFSSLNADPLTPGSYSNAPVVRIFEGEEERTRNYEIAVAACRLTIEKRPLSVTALPVEFVYDGVPHVFDREGEHYELSSETPLVEGHTLTVTRPLSATFVGEYENRPEFAVMNGGSAVTDCYAVAVLPAAVTVTPRPVRVQTLSRSFVFDGTAHDYTGYTVLGADGEENYGLVSGDELRVGSSPNIRNVGSVKNALVFSVMSGRDDRSRNYRIEIADVGDLTVTPRPVSLSTASADFVYNGRPQGKSDGVFEPIGAGEESGLVPGHRAEAVGCTTWTDADAYENRCDGFRIVSGAGDETGNYEIDPSYGTVTIRRLAVSLGIEAPAAEYDGEEHSASAADWKVGSGSLAAGHRAAADNYPSYTDVGTHSDYRPTGAKIVDAAGNDVTGNYEVSWLDGTFSIVKRKLTFVSNSASWVYDAKEHSAYSAGDYTAENLVPGDEFTAILTDWAKIVGKGTADNVLDFTEFSVRGARGDVTENYEIAARQWGTLQITPRPVTVVTGSRDKIYDGIASPCEDETKAEYPADYPALKGHEFIFTPTNVDSLIPVGEHVNGCSARVTAGGGDVTDNYAITYRFGTLTVNPRPVRLTTRSETFGYDGRDHSVPAYDLAEVGENEGVLTEFGHRLEVTNGAVIRNAGSKDNTMTFVVRDGAGGDVTDNYDFGGAVWGTLEVTKRQVSLQCTHPLPWEYDGEEHSASADDWEVADGSLADGHSADADVYLAFRNAGRNHGILTEGAKILDEEGNDVTDNYDVTWAEGDLEIEKRSVTLSSESGEFEYDGTAHSVPSYREAENSLVPGHFAEAEYPKITDVGDEVNSPSRTHIVDEEGNEVTDNYIVSWTDHGTVTVYKREITVRTASGEWTYDGKPHSTEEFGDEEIDAPDRLVAGHVFEWTVTYRPTIRDAEGRKPGAHGGFDTYEGKPNDIAVEFTVKDASGRLVTDNYELKYEYGKLVVKARPLTIMTGSGTWVYDGQEHSVSELICGDELVEGHVFEGRLINPEKIIEVSSKSNYLLFASYEYTIYGVEGDVTKNYEASWSFGTLTVTPRPIAILLTENLSWVYDGRDHAYDSRGWTVDWKDGRIAGHEVQVDLKVTFRNVGVYPISAANVAGNVAVFDRNDRNHSEVTGNYSVSIVGDGKTVTIEKRKVRISSGSETFVYDGEEHRTERIEWQSEEGDAGLLAGHRIAVTDGKRVKDVTDSKSEAGYVVNELAAEFVRIYDDGTFDGNGEPTEVTDNYEFEFDNRGRLRVKPPIAIRVFNLAEEYDGKAHGFGGEDYIVTSRPVDVPLSAIRVELVGTLTDVGALSLEDIASMSGDRCSVEGGDGIDRFDFTGSEYPLRVTPRKLKIKTQSHYARHNGDAPYVWLVPVDGVPYWFSYGSLADGHSISYNVSGVLSPTAEEAELRLDNVRILDGRGTEVTGNYNIEYEWGKLRWLAED